MHGNLVEMIKENMPHIEYVNKKCLKEAGTAVQHKVRKLKEEIQKEGVKRPSSTASRQAEDQDAELLAIERKMEKMLAEFDPERENFEEDEETKDLARASNQMEHMFSKLEKNEDKNDRMLMNFEKNFGLRIKKMMDGSTKKAEDGEEEEEEDDGLDEDLKDGIEFRDTMKKNFMDYRTNFKTIVGDIRTTEYSVFAKLGLARSETQANKDSYKKMESEVEMIKRRLGEAKTNTKRQFKSDVQDNISEEEEEDSLEGSDQDAGDEEADFYDHLSDKGNREENASQMADNEAHEMSNSHH